MNNLDFNKILSKELNNTVDNKYILLGVPKHMNLGDTLIWEAETQILDSLNKERCSTYFFNTNPDDINVNKDTILVWNGGGYFSDVWGGTLKYIENILTKFNDNKHIFLPNSVFFNNESNLISINNVLKQCNNEIIVYSRELQSYKQAFKLENVTNILMPDIVLGWDINKYMKEHNIKNTTGTDVLYISRNDREKLKGSDFEFTTKSDWPTLINKPSYVKYSNINDWEKYVKPLLVNDSINFIMPYNKVYSDRMHGAILSWLLNKETILIDNSYHKSKSLYDTWLVGLEKIMCK